MQKPFADVVIEGFVTLISKYDIDDKRIDFRTMKEALTPERVEWNTEVLNRLQLNLLPLLEQQIASLSLSLDPARLLKDPLFIFDLILGIQAQLDQTLTQILSALDIICPEPTYHSSDRRDDLDYKAVKYFRICRLYPLIINDLIDDVHSLFENSWKLIQTLELTTDKRPLPTDNQIAVARKAIINDTSSCYKGIKTAIRWISGSEFSLALRDWPEGLRDIDPVLEKLLRLIKRTPLNGEHREAQDEPISEPVIEVAQTLLPIVKLCRLFLTQSTRWMSQKGLPIFSGMASDDLETLSFLAMVVQSDLQDFLPMLKEPARNDEAVTRYHFTRATNSLHERFNASIYLMDHYFVPMIPDTQDRHHCDTWLTTWWEEFGLAIDQLTNAFEALDGRSFD